MDKKVCNEQTEKTDWNYFLKNDKISVNRRKNAYIFQNLNEIQSNLDLTIAKGLLKIIKSINTVDELTNQNCSNMFFLLWKKK